MDNVTFLFWILNIVALLNITNLFYSVYVILIFEIHFTQRKTYKLRIEIKINKKSFKLYYHRILELILLSNMYLQIKKQLHFNIFVNE